MHACVEYAAEILEREKVRALIRTRLAEADAGAFVPADDVWRELDEKFGPPGDAEDDER